MTNKTLVKTKSKLYLIRKAVTESTEGVCRAIDRIGT